MLAAAYDARELAGNLSYEQFIADRRTRLAVERTFEILGEAARRVSDGTRAGHPDIPWAGIIGTRNALAHQYGAIDYRLLYVAVSEGVPKLIVSLENVLKP